MISRTIHNPHRRSAFTLVETLAALIIFSVAIIAFIQGMGVTIASQGDLLGEQRAVILAQDILEELRYTGDLTEDTQEGQFEGDDAYYAWEARIERTETTGLMSVIVIISWDDGRGDRAYQLETLMLQQEEV